MKDMIGAGLMVVGLVAGLGDLAVPARAEADASPPAVEKTARVTHVQVSEAAQRLREASLVVLDLRTPQEFAGGYIGGATNLDYLARDFERQLARLDRSATYLVYCASGNRSTRALPVLAKHGFAKLIHLDGGFAAWKKAGQPVAR